MRSGNLGAFSSSLVGGKHVLVDEKWCSLVPWWQELVPVKPLAWSLISVSLWCGINLDEMVTDLFMNFAILCLGVHPLPGYRHTL